MYAMNDESFALELQRTFLGETQEMLEETETAFLHIEANPDDTTRIDKIFRLVHTIKGSALSCGFTELGQFAHIFETLLAGIRNKQLKVDSSIADILLLGNDCLRNFVAVLKLDPEASFDTSAVALRIKQACPGSRAPEAAPAMPFPSLPKTASQRTFLVCEDDGHMLKILKDLLESEGYAVVCAKNGTEALALMRERVIDVIMSDLKMPEMDGEQFVREVRKFNALIPIVIVSGYSSREHLKAFVQLGVDEFVEKPFEDRYIQEAARRSVKMRLLREALLGLSRLSFKSYVSIQKIESLSLMPEFTQEKNQEKIRLDQYMEEMKAMTHQVLSSERALQSEKFL